MQKLMSPIFKKSKNCILLFNLSFILTLAACGNFTNFKGEPRESNLISTPGGPESGGTNEATGGGDTPDDPLNPDQPLPPDFNQVTNLIFEPHCTRCHSQYADYSAVVGELRSIQNAIESNRMPKNARPLSADLKALLAAWVNAGAPFAVAVPQKPTQPVNPADPSTPVVTPTPLPTPPPPPVLEPTWTSLNRIVFSARCTVCHSPNGEANFLNLTSRQKIFEIRDKEVLGQKYLDFNSPDDSYVMSVITDPDSPMPPRDSGFAPLTSKEVDTVREWIRLGLP